VNDTSFPGIAELFNRPAWMTRGLCRWEDRTLFYPPAHGNQHTRTEAAKAICARCPVRRECLDHATATNEPYGIWGGQTPNERGAT